jgi:hypothetical protein
VAALFRRDSYRLPQLPETLMLLIIAVILTAHLIPAIFSLPLNYDANTYRLGRIGYWLQEGSIGHFDTYDRRQLFMAINCDLVMLWLTSFFHTGYPLVHLAQWFGGVLACAATYAMARTIGFTRLWALAGSLFLLGIPNAATMLLTAQSDLFTTGCLAAGLYFLMRALADTKPLSYAFSGKGIGLAVGAKGTVFYWGPGLLFWFCGQLLLQRPRWRPLLGGLLLCGAVATAVGGFNYFQNIATFGHPLAPPKRVKYLHQDTDGLTPERSSNLRFSLYLWQLFEPGSNLPLIHPMSGAALEFFEERILEKLVGVKDKVTLRFDDARRWVREWRYSEDYLSFGSVTMGMVLLGGATATLGLFRARQRTVSLQIFLMCSSVALFALYFSYVRAWSIHQYRYAVLLTPFLGIIGVFFSQRIGRITGALLLALLLAYQACFSLTIAVNGLSHGWRTLVNLPSAPNYRFYWREPTDFMTYFEGRRRHIALVINNLSRWVAPLFRRPTNHRISMYTVDQLKSFQTVPAFLEATGNDLLITDMRLEDERFGRVNFYLSADRKYFGFEKLAEGVAARPAFYQLDVYRDGWTTLTPKFKLWNWPRDTFEIRLRNPTNLRRTVHIYSSMEEKTLYFPAGMSTFKTISIRVRPENDAVQMQIAPPFVPRRSSVSQDSRQLGLLISHDYEKVGRYPHR